MFIKMKIISSTQVIFILFFFWSAMQMHQGKLFGISCKSNQLLTDFLIDPPTTDTGGIRVTAPTITVSPQNIDTILETVLNDLRQVKEFTDPDVVLKRWYHLMIPMTGDIGDRGKVILHVEKLCETRKELAILADQYSIEVFWYYDELGKWFIRQINKNV